uniref:Uncharacterized protein n=1 Tax=Timema douglasi TaxID=61478 RepID=A0A7R8VD29_TIMDO|nr:unnamed protein product [Timema douglasi]
MDRCPGGARMYTPSRLKGEGRVWQSDKSVPGPKIETRALSTEVRHLAPKPPGHLDINKSVRILNGKSNSNSNRMSVDDVDMYTGMLSEFPVEGGVLGPTVSCLITDQFLRLKFGDRFWYETPQQPQAFTPGKYSEHVNNDRLELDEIRKTTLAGLICDTSDSVEQLQPYVMRSTKSDNTPVKCSSVPRPNLSLWKETDGEFVKTGFTHLKLGASVAVPQVIKAVPKTIRIGARVTGGSVTMNSGTWKPTFPVTIPVSPFDAIATSDEVPSVEAPTYGHSIVWRGTLSEISPSGDLKISATFSLPKYVHGTNLFFIEWLNGNIQFHLNTVWNATGKSLLPATGLFSSSVHFKDTWKYSYLKDVDPWLFEPSLSLKNDFSANPNVVLEPKTGCAVIILLGSYSSDRSLFLWSGELTLVLSTATEEIAMSASSKLFVKQSNVNTLTDAIPSTTRVVAAVTGGSVSTSSGSWTSTFPVGIPVYPFEDVASSYMVDALADTTLPVYGHGIIWQGTVSKPSLSETLQVSGSFSLPKFMHGDPSTFSIQWLNGDFTFQLQPLYNITGLDSLPITDVFSSSVYFQERKEYAYLKNLPPPSSGSLPVSFTSTPSVVGGPDVRHAPIIMLGTYSLDRSIFWWSGNASLYVKNKILPMTSQVSWSEKNKESVSVKLSNLNERSSTSDLQETEPIPKTLTLSAKVTGGSFTTNSGTWKSKFPVTLPVRSFDAISEVPAVKPLTYGHGILWRGTLSEILPSGDVTLSATFSLPRYVHGPEMFDMEWLNGNIQLHLHTLSNVTGKTLLPVNGLFYSSVHFKETWQYSYLKDVDPLLFEPNLSLKNDFSVNPDIVYEPKIGQGEIILLGAYTSDYSSFLWSGELTLVLSTATEEIAMPASSKLFVKQSNVNSLTDAIPSTTRVVAAVTGGSVSTSSGSWTSTFPVGIPVYPFNDVASSYMVDALADTTLPVYGHGIIWQGTVSKPSLSETLQVSGSFSLPKFMHGDPSTFSIQWLNGDFTFQLQPLYNITGLDSLPITDVFSSSVYFQERKEYAYLKNLPPPSSGSLPVSFTSTPSVVGGPDVRHAPIIMLGTYSLDRSIFWWSGNASLYVKNKILPMTSQVSWSEKNKESVSVKLSNLNERSSTSDLQETKPIPKTLTLSAKVTGGSFTTNSGTWKSKFPVTLPVRSFDAISEVPAVKPLTYGHGILWRGTLSEILPSGDVTLSATFSLPRYVHGPEMFDMEWLNGNIQLHLNTLSNVTGKTLLPVNGLFYSSVHFKETWQYSYLKDVDPLLFEPNLSLKNDFSVNPDIIYEPKIGQGEIILLGAYTSDYSSFLWSGELTLVLSTATEEIAMPASTPVVVAGQSTFPVGIPVYPFNDVASSYMVDALADTTLPVYGHGIIWQGTVSKPSLSETLQVSGSFSLPKFMHGDPSTFSIQWLNGDFTFQLQPLYNITGLDSLPITDVFSSSVYFQERKEYAYLKNLPPPSSGSLPLLTTSDTLVTPVMGQGIIWSANFSNNFTSGDRLNGEFSFTRYVHGNVSSTSAVEFWRGSFTFDIDLAANTSLEGLVNPDITFTSPVYFTSTPGVPITTTLFSSETAASTQAPIILEGNFSPDRSSFSWTGNAKLILPTMKLLESSAKSVTKVSVGAEVISGNISVSGTNVWSGSLPVPIPVLKTKPLASGTPIFGNKISWSGNIVTNSSGEVKFTGTFSSQNLTGGSPLSGDFSFDLSLVWNTTVNDLVKPSSVYSSIIILSDMKASQSTNQVLTSTPMSDGVSTSLIPIILKGSYSPDNTIFYWSGNAIVSFPN